MPDLRWFVGPEAGDRAGKIVVAFSGGKDSLAALLYVIECCLKEGLDPSGVIECWHYSVDGRPWFYGGSTETEWDWPVSEDYCRKICACLGIPLYFGWKVGGLMGEVLKGGKGDPLVGVWPKATGGPRPIPPTVVELPTGELIQTGGVRGALYVRRSFPAKTASLTTRWCTAYGKVDVSRTMTTSRDYLEQARTLIVTGERAEESPARAKYFIRKYESGVGAGGRHVEQWRAIHKWCEIDVWAIIYRWRMRPHPAYMLGWGRLSCQTCVFGSDTMWASIREVDPGKFGKFAGLEAELKREKDRLLRDLEAMTPAEVKRVAYDRAMAASKAQWEAGSLTPKQAAKQQAEILKDHKSGKLAKGYRVSITGRIPWIDRDEPLTVRTTPRWRNAKKKEIAAHAEGRLGMRTRLVKPPAGGRRKKMVLQVWDPAEPFPQVANRRMVRIALDHRWTESPIMDPWRLPAGAFGEASGPS
jgi:3'-phosphoadenosine 5'-phosphosulfate sulfotransferase (PAPS reductase)/FAD synthetase